MAYAVDYPPSQFNFNVLVAILHHDGSVAVSHGGIEMGQGINTKVAFLIRIFLFSISNCEKSLGSTSCGQGTRSRFILGVH